MTAEALAARNIVRNCIRIKARERVLILADKKFAALARLLHREAGRISKRATLQFLERLDGREPPDSVAHAMRDSDVVIAVARYSLTHSRAAALARRSGARLASMPNVTLSSWRGGALRADYIEVKAAVEAAYARFKAGRRFDVSSAGGTALRFAVAGSARWIREWGLIHRRGDLDNLPAGMIAVRPEPGTASGRLVFDRLKGCRGRVGLELRRGLITRVDGDPAARRLFYRFGARSRRLAEFGLGCNAWARTAGNTVESEKALGACHFGFGNDVIFGGANHVTFHRDGIVRKPTILADGKTLVSAGSFSGKLSGSYRRSSPTCPPGWRCRSKRWRYRLCGSRRWSSSRP